MIDLIQFCGVDDVRIYINEPFSEGAFTYATNGHIMIRVPRIDGFPEANQHMVGKPAKMFADNPMTEPVEIPELPATTDADCDCCGGSGWHYIPCGDTPCASCEDGKVKVVPPIDIGDGRYNSEYMRMVKALPNVAISQCDNVKPMVFKFDGGDGLLMPMRKK